jgi:hypothetical protein
VVEFTGDRLDLTVHPHAHVVDDFLGNWFVDIGCVISGHLAFLVWRCVPASMPERKNRDEGARLQRFPASNVHLYARVKE